MKSSILSVGALLAASGVGAQITQTIVTVIQTNTASVLFNDSGSQAAYSSLLSVDRSELAAATSSTLQPIQATALEAALSAFETGALASLTSGLATEIPKSILTKYLSIGYTSLEQQYNSSFAQQSWYSAVENVHTQVQNAIVTIEAAILTLTSNSTSTTAIPTTGAATVTQANLTSVSITSASLTPSATGQSGSVSGSATASSSSGSGAVPTDVPKAIMGMAGVAAGVLGMAAIL
ncbi:hypothetical protein MMC14_004234 [Varicellaria rhodocarpa]|nr:hypothetical protein [Varicellaria rhodocarpa]